MALSHTPLDVAKLSPAAQKALAPGPMKLMAARGLAPLPNPAELAAVLYQLALDADAKVKDAARKAAAELPDKVLGPALSDPSLDPRVLDFFAAQVAGRPGLIDAVLDNRATADETIAQLAGRLGEREIEIIAANEQRLLRCPEIIGAMYMNRAARMSTVDRAVELAVRNQIKVPGIPAWDEVVASVLGTKKEARATSAEVDALFATAVAVTAARGGEAGAEEAEEPVDDRDLPISEMTIPMKIRLAMLGNAFARAALIRDANKMVAMAAIKAPGVTEIEAAKYAANNSLNEDVIGYIATRRDWTKLYNIKHALVQNPKTPLAASMRLLSHLREKDVRALARSKSVPSALATQARKLVMTRTGPRGAGKE